MTSSLCILLLEFPYLLYQRGPAQLSRYYRLDGPGIESQWCETFLGPTQPPIQ